MTNVTIGRYDGCTIVDDSGERPLTDEYAGWVEGSATDGTPWIVYLGPDGRPAVYYAARELDGAVVGDPVTL